MDKKMVVIVGSGFGGSVAALRFAEAGHKVTVLERGDWIRREEFEADPDMFWLPRRQRFGMNELRKRGRTIIPWLGSGVGGGSHVYAATIKRRYFFDDWPKTIKQANLTPYYEKAEAMMQAKPYPNYAPYNQIPSYALLRKVEKEMMEEMPELVEEQGPILLALSFAPEGVAPGSTFTNSYGATQRYAHPEEQKILGGDIESKNTLDKNYLHLAIQHGAEIKTLSVADKITKNNNGYSVEYITLHKETNWFKRGIKNWFPSLLDEGTSQENIDCDILILSAGAIGSTEILMRNKWIHKTLPQISETLGSKYFSNGDYVSLMLPFDGLVLGWLSFVGLVLSLIFGNVWAIITAFALYYLVMALTNKSYNPDLGTTNSDFIRFKHRDGSTQGSYIEGGRYPTLLRASLAFILSVMGLYRPGTYRGIVRFTTFLQRWVPPFELINRSWPIPLLQMGRDDAIGSFSLNKKGRIDLIYSLKANVEYYNYLENLAKKVAAKARSWFIPNLAAKLSGTIEVPHNLGGAMLGDSISEGVVDHAGRVFGYDNLMVLDGSIIPVTLGPNPVGTILALSERGTEVAIAQLVKNGKITTDK